jgi:FMN-dependent NADH-azoreductase
MTKQILVVDSSPRSGSLSRKFTREIADRLIRRHAGARIVHRDVTAQPLPHLTLLYPGAGPERVPAAGHRPFRRGG